MFVAFSFTINTSILELLHVKLSQLTVPDSTCQWISSFLTDSKQQEHRGLLTLHYPMEHGVVRDCNDMERIWQYVYSKDQLQTFSEEVPCPSHFFKPPQKEYLDRRE
ncbi:hypothetical protein SKAU_G00141120 [Synaphobranchus kaupii]|uniref:Uncharacterized protein n=1 Tax=Synaphobranchus kaupii TaxID=118154 RepID=A0A9Q1FSW4_SYNKA|nr:hypothetical protein SKAU_G00141120 [Synaphobranchus kaupii]